VTEQLTTEHADSGAVLRLAQVAEAIAATTKKTEKVRLTAEYLGSLGSEDAARAALFLSGRAFPAWEETTLQVGGALLWSALRQISGASDADLTAAYRRHGDLGSAAADILAAATHQGEAEPPLALAAIEQAFRAIAGARGPAAKLEGVLALLRRADALSAKYLIKIMGGEMRIGLRESLVEEAIARAYKASLTEVQRGNMLVGSLSNVVQLAAAGRLHEARMRLFHPLGFMLASPAQSAREAFEYISTAAVEDKYDGIRAQAHVLPSGDGARVKLFSRTLDDVTESFPELAPALSTFAEEVVLDGEIVAWSASAEQEGRGALPFFELQKRLGRKHVTEPMMQRVPVAYIVFDVLYCAGALQIDEPLRERRQLLERLFASRVPQVMGGRPGQALLAFEFVNPADHSDAASGKVLLAPVWQAGSTEDLDRLFEQALERGNEGLMIKDVASTYTPGRRGKSWLKLKRELATLDVVVTAVEYGHGKRAQVLSDYTFAVRGDSDKLLNVGKAYSGLTDVEIAEMTEWFRAHTIEDFGFRRLVEPKTVLEVAFNAVMKSDRHESGFALRFPRILRLRPDKPVGEIDTLERVRQIWEKQGFENSRP
jgi:DNA ligase-1